MDLVSILISLLTAALGIILMLVSKPTILFENLDEKEEKKELAEIERGFIEYVIKNLRQDRVHDFFYVDKIRESYNSVIKIVGLLEDIMAQYEQGLLHFRRMSLLFGSFLVVAAVFLILTSLREYVTFALIIFISTIGTLLFSAVLLNSLRLSKMIKNYKEYKKVLRQQRSNVLFKEIMEELS